MKAINWVRFIISFIFLTQTPVSYGQNLVKMITFSDTVKDYGPVLQKAVNEIAKAGKGTIKIKYGIYPVLTQVTLEKKTGSLDIVVTGVKNAKGKLPVLKDADSTRAPHGFFQFHGNAAKPELTITISNIELVGNNIPYSPSHPFFGKPTLIYSHALSGLNVRTMKVENVTIRNFYGRGIMIGNYFNRKYDRRHRAESPIVRNCKILNVWGFSRKDDAGDGVEFISAHKPVVENNVILNNLPDSKYMGRCGVVLEHNTENAIIRNNVIGGYSRNIHVECDWGGHLIEKNKFSQSSVAVQLSEDCAQSDTLKNHFGPIIIRNNTMAYNGELLTYKIPRAKFAFVTIYKPSFMLDGLQIINNKMTIVPEASAKQAVSANARSNNEKDQKAYIDVKNQAKVTIKGNSFN